MVVDARSYFVASSFRQATHSVAPFKFRLWRAHSKQPHTLRIYKIRVCDDFGRSRRTTNMIFVKTP